MSRPSLLWWLLAGAIAGSALAGSKGSVLLTALPLHGHFVPLCAVGVELAQLGYSVTMFSFDQLHVAGKPARARDYLPSDAVKFISLGQLPEGFDAYGHDQTVIAMVHRAMYSRLGMSGPGNDAWVIDAHALGAIAAAQDAKAHQTMFIPSLTSEFMHSVKIFGLEQQVEQWPVIAKGTSMFDPPQYDKYGPYPSTFQFVGYDELDKKTQQLPADLELWLTKQSEPVVYISLAAIPDLKLGHIAAISKVMSSSGLSVVWSVPDMHTSAVVASDKLFVSSWVPQHAVLLHQKVKVFVSNCGLNGALESVVAQVPVVCIPQSGEQLRIANRLTFLTLGSVLATSDYDSATLGAKVLERVKLLASDLRYAVSLEHMHKALIQAGGSAKAAAIIDESLATKNAILFQNSAGGAQATSFGTVNSAAM